MPEMLPNCGVSVLKRHVAQSHATWPEGLAHVTELGFLPGDGGEEMLWLHRAFREPKVGDSKLDLLFALHLILHDDIFFRFTFGLILILILMPPLTEFLSLFNWYPVQCGADNP